MGGSEGTEPGSCVVPRKTSYFLNETSNFCLFITPKNSVRLAPTEFGKLFKYTADKYFGKGPAIFECKKGFHINGTLSRSFVTNCKNSVVQSIPNCVDDSVLFDGEKKVYYGSITTYIFIIFSVVLAGISTAMASFIGYMFCYKHA